MVVALARIGGASGVIEFLPTDDKEAHTGQAGQARDKNSPEKILVMYMYVCV